MYKGLPNDQSQASHLGYGISGKVISRKADGSEEVFEAGDAFVIKPGHTEWLAAGTEFVVFTPAEEDAAEAQVVQANLMKYLQEHGIEMPG
jgi:quercetin dioxygenase-like cupin family protein